MGQLGVKVRLVTGMKKAHAPVVSRGWACNSDNHEPNYETMVDMKLRKLRNYEPNLDKTNYGPSCESRVDLHLAQKRLGSSCKSRMDLQVGQKKVGPQL
jgi:hypothetical protein